MYVARWMPLAAVLSAPWPAAAAVLEVGPNQTFRQPSEAIAAAADGDTVRIAPGQYYDCATVSRNDLTIEGTAPGAILTDKTCSGKALLVVDGRNVTVRDLTLQRARVWDRNGAGIRAEGTNLTVQRVTFFDNEDGILAADIPDSTIRILDSEFRRNGRCAERCTEGIAIGHIALLRIERSRFLDTRGAIHIMSAAARTDILDSTVADQATGTAGTLIDLPYGGELLLSGNRFEKGPKAAGNRVVMIGRDGTGGTRQVIEKNTLVDDGAGVTALVLNWGSADPVVSGNVLPKGVTPVSTGGAMADRIHYALYRLKLSAEKVLNVAKRGARKVLSIL
jgi:hypothetical protein